MRNWSSKETKYFAQGHQAASGKRGATRPSGLLDISKGQAVFLWVKKNFFFDRILTKDNYPKLTYDAFQLKLWNLQCIRDKNVISWYAL